MLQMWKEFYYFEFGDHLSQCKLKNQEKLYNRGN